MKPMNNLDKAKFGQREFNMKHMFILQPAFALFSLPPSPPIFARATPRLT